MATRHISSFLIDVAPTMGALRGLEERVRDPTAPAGVRTTTRSVTQLAYVLEWVVHKVQHSLLAQKKTNKVNIMLFNSRTTDNHATASSDGAAPGHNVRGIHEIWRPAPATAHLVRALTRLRPETELDPEAADPLDTLVCAINAMLDKDHSEISSAQRRTWTRTVYIITDGLGPLSPDELGEIQRKLLAEEIEVKVVGIGFGQSEQEMGPKKWQAQAVWVKFLEGLGEYGALVTADEAVEQARMPMIFPRDGVGSSTVLTFGDASTSRMGAARPDVLQVPVKVRPWTQLARPIARNELATIASDADAHPQVDAQQTIPGAHPSHEVSLALPSGITAHVSTSLDVSGGNPPLQAHGHAVGQAERASRAPEQRQVLTPITRTEVMYDRAQWSEAVALGRQDDLPPLPMDVERLKGFKLGADIVPLAEGDMVVQRTRPGLEILKFGHQDKYYRPWMLGPAFYVTAEGSPAGQVMLSSLVQALDTKGDYALARYVARPDTAPRLVVLFPVIVPANEDGRGRLEALCMVNTAFREDMREYAFPSLPAPAGESSEGKTQQDAMDDLVQAMDLRDEHGTSTFDLDEAYSFNVHGVNQAVLHRATFPTQPLPAPYEELARYLSPPPGVRDRAAPALARAKDAFQIRTLALRPNKRSPEHVELPSKRVRDDDPAAEEQGYATRVEAEAEAEAEAAAGEDAEAELDAGELQADEMETEQAYPLSDPVGAFEEDVSLDRLGDIHLSIGRMGQTIAALLLARREVAAAEADPRDRTVRDCLRRARVEAQEQDVAPQWNAALRSLRHWLARYVWGRAWWAAHIAPPASAAEQRPQPDDERARSADLASALELGLIPAGPRNRVTDVDTLAAIAFVQAIRGPSL